jgi:formyltetrahydrofolate-dependent phosphoribosylglycinamide formyltransferase
LHFLIFATLFNHQLPFLKNIVVFASGSGSNFQAIIDSIHRKEMDARIAGLVVNREKAGAVKRAENHDIPVFLYEENDESALNAQLQAWETDLIVLAGYLKMVPSSTIRLYPERIINIHPSLLPKYGGKGFYGMKVHEAVIQNRDQESGCTVHFVNEVYDEGPIIQQVRVPVNQDDTAEKLAARVLEQEHKLLPEVIKTLIQKY